MGLCLRCLSACRQERLTALQAELTMVRKDLELERQRGAEEGVCGCAAVLYCRRAEG